MQVAHSMNILVNSTGKIGKKKFIMDFANETKENFQLLVYWKVLGYHMNGWWNNK